MKKKRKSNLKWCEGDYRHGHYWERVGISSDHYQIYVYYLCTQCHKWKREELEFVKGGI